MLRAALLAVILSLALLSPARAADAPALDPLIAQAKTYKLGQSRAALEKIQDIVVRAAQDPQQRKAVAARMAALLSEEATFEARDFACRQLYIIATPAEVPAVARLLPDEKLSHMARYVLEAMADPAADAALREGLTTVKGRLLIGVVNSLGNRRDGASLPAFKTLLGGDDPALATAAATALGKLGAPEAAAALAQHLSAADPAVKAAVTDAYLVCADELLKAGKKDQAAAMFEQLRGDAQPQRMRLAALRGLVAADPDKAMPMLMALLKGNDPAQAAIAASFLRNLPGERVTATLTAALPTLPAANQPALIDTLAARAEPAARASVLAALRSPAAPVRAAALRALATLGGPSEVGVLAEAATRGAERDIARDSLARLRGNTVDQALVSALVSQDAEVRAEIVRALAARRAVSANPSLLDLAVKDPSEPVRLAAIRALGELASDAEVPALIDRLVQARNDAERDAIKQALGSASTRLKDRDAASAPAVAALPNATGPTKVALISALTRIGGTKALAAVRAAQQDADAAVREAAVRGLIDWADAAAIPDVLALARSENPTYKALALRGLFQLMAKPGAPDGAEAMKVYQQMMAAATRPDDKKVVLAKLGEVKDPGALDIVMPLLADDAVRAEAAAAATRIARALGARSDPATAALRKIAEDQRLDASQRKAAQDLLNRNR